MSALCVCLICLPYVSAFDWFTEWPAEALAGVANEAFAEIEFPSDEVKAGIVSLCRDIHQAETPLLPCTSRSRCLACRSRCLAC